MQQTQLQLLKLWFQADRRVRAAAMRNDRGEVTGQTALIVLLVTAAIAAGVAITSAISANTGRIPTP